MFRQEPERGNREHTGWRVRNRGIPTALSNPGRLGKCPRARASGGQTVREDARLARQARRRAVIDDLPRRARRGSCCPRGSCRRPSGPQLALRRFVALGSTAGRVCESREASRPRLNAIQQLGQGRGDARAMANLHAFVVTDSVLVADGLLRRPPNGARDALETPRDRSRGCNARDGRRAKRSSSIRHRFIQSGR